MILNVEIAERNDIMGKVTTRYAITNEYRQEMARTTLGIVLQAEIDDAMKLIAAAPELLAALEAFVYAESTDHPDDYRRALLLAVPAIKKAEGA